jgi:hypothetical protein
MKYFRNGTRLWPVNQSINEDFVLRYLSLKTIVDFERRH